MTNRSLRQRTPLRGYVENRGGKIVGASVMVAGRDSVESVDIVVKQKMLTAIKQKHGEAMNDFWKETFSYGIEKLTQSEAGHIRKCTSVDAIRDRSATARHEGIRRMDEGRIKKSPSPTGERPDGLRPSEGLLASTQNLEVTQEALLSDGHVNDALNVYVQAKHGQVQRIESRLHRLINRQQDSLQQLIRNKPGLLSLPNTRQVWQTQKTQQQSRL